MRKPTVGCVKGAVPANTLLFAAPQAPRRKNGDPTAPKAPRQKITMAALKAPRRKIEGTDSDSFTLAVGPIIELKKIIKLFHFSSSFTFQILTIIIELKKYYESYCKLEKQRNHTHILTDIHYSKS